MSEKAVVRVLAQARAEVGYLEKKTNENLYDATANAGYNNFTKYANDLDTQTDLYNGKKNGYAWCDAFVDWLFYVTFGIEMTKVMTGQSSGCYGAGCSYSAKYYKAIGAWHTDPQPGDQIFFTKDGGSTFYHTGIVERVEGGKVYTIEGNTSSVAGVEANGGAVRDKSYALTYSYIGGYGRPKYELVDVEEEITEEEETMTLDQFKILHGQMMAELKDNDCDTWSEQARNWVKNSGILAGSGDVGGEPNMMWQDTLTREQLAVVLYKFCEYLLANHENT